MTREMHGSEAQTCAFITFPFHGHGYADTLLEQRKGSSIEARMADPGNMYVPGDAADSSHSS